MDYFIHHVRLNALALRANVHEILNSLTHGAGLALALAASFLLLSRAAVQADGWRIAGCLIFATTLTGVFPRFHTWPNAAPGGISSAPGTRP
jgi:predicted membrane channel-forming protein YqfA (hemolysin III family)